MATPVQEIGSGTTFRESPDAWQTKVQEAMHLPFPVAWLLAGGAIFLIGLGIQSACGESPATLRLLAIDAALIAAIANAVVFYERLLDDAAESFFDLLDEDRGRIREWLCEWYRELFWSRKTLMAGSILGTICAFLGARGNAAPLSSTAGILYSRGVAFLIGFFGGSMFWTMSGAARLMSSLGRDVKITASIFDSDTSALRAASSVLWKVSIVACLVYLLGLSRCFFSSLRIGPESFVVIALTGCFLVLYFVVPQLNIHKTLVKLKRSRLRALVGQIDESFTRVADNPTRENIEQLRELFNLQRVLNGKRSWSFGTGELLLLLGSVLVPLALFGLEYFLRR